MGGVWEGIVHPSTHHAQILDYICIDLILFDPCSNFLFQSGHPSLTHSLRNRGRGFRSSTRKHRSSPGNAGSFSSPPCKNLSQRPYPVPRPCPSTPSTPNLCDYGLTMKSKGSDHKSYFIDKYMITKPSSIQVMLCIGIIVFTKKTHNKHHIYLLDIETPT